MDLLRLYDPYQRAMRRERVFRDRSNPFEVYSDAELLKKYRFHREGLRYLIDILDDGLAPKTLRNHAISKELKVFIGLRYLASGAHQSLVGDEMAIKVTQPTVSRCVSEFLDAMMGIVPALIFWPDDSSACKLHFFERYNIPNVVGCIDGTHVEIISPPDKSHQQPPYRHDCFQIISVVVHFSFSQANGNPRVLGQENNSEAKALHSQALLMTSAAYKQHT